MARFLLVVAAVSVLFSTACAPSPAPTVTPRADGGQHSTMQNVSTSSMLDAAAQPSAAEQSASSSDSAAAAAVVADTAADAVAQTAPDSAATHEATPDSAAASNSSASVMGEGVLTFISSPAGSEVSLISLDGTNITPLITGLDRNGRAAACGDHSTTRDGRYLALYAGGVESGRLYLMDGTNPPTAVADAEYLACVMNAVQFSDDGARFAYIAYPAGSTREAYAAGRLNVIETESRASLLTLDNVVAFDLTDTGAVSISLYRNSEGEADEAAVNLWDGASEREIATLVPTQENCRFMSAQIEQAPDGSIVLVMGQRCDNITEMQWQFYLVGTDGTVNLVSSDRQPGDFVAFARNNNLFFAPAGSPAGSIAYFTVPDGLTANTVALAAVDLSNLSISVIIDRQAVFPTFSGASNAEPRLSPNERWLGLVTTSPNNDNSLFALDLSDRANPPIIISAGARGDSISSLAFTPDNSRIVYTAGGAEGADNSVFQLDLANGTESRVRRGTFGRSLVVSPDSVNVALNEILSVTEGSRTFTYNATRLVNLITNTETNLFEDTTSPPDQRRSAIPIAWRTTP